MKNGIRLHDVVALTTDMPEKKLRRGQVGTIVEILAPEVFERRGRKVPLRDDGSQF